MARHVRLRVRFELLYDRVVVLSFVVLGFGGLVLERAVAFDVSVRINTLVVLFEFIPVVVLTVVIIKLLYRLGWCHPGDEGLRLLFVEGQVSNDDVAICVDQVVEVVGQVH